MSIYARKAMRRASISLYSIVAAALLAICCASSTALGADHVLLVDSDSRTFQPSQLSIHVGDMVQFRFTGDPWMAHTATEASGPCVVADTPLFDFFADAEQRFVEAGVYSVMSNGAGDCEAGMRATITVLPADDTAKVSAQAAGLTLGSVTNTTAPALPGTIVNGTSVNGTIGNLTSGNISSNVTFTSNGTNYTLDWLSNSLSWVESGVKVNVTFNDTLFNWSNSSQWAALTNGSITAPPLGVNSSLTVDPFPSKGGNTITIPGSNSTQSSNGSSVGSGGSPPSPPPSVPSASTPSTIPPPPPPPPGVTPLPPDVQDQLRQNTGASPSPVAAPAPTTGTLTNGTSNSTNTTAGNGTNSTATNSTTNSTTLNGTNSTQGNTSNATNATNNTTPTPRLNNSTSNITVVPVSAAFIVIGREGGLFAATFALLLVVM